MMSTFHRWDSASSVSVNDTIDTFDILMCKNIYGFKNVFSA